MEHAMLPQKRTRKGDPLNSQLSPKKSPKVSGDKEMIDESQINTKPYSAHGTRQ